MTVFKEITNEDIYQKIEAMSKTQGEILEHAKYTNGKIAEAIKQIEGVKKRSFGVWVSNHPVRAIIIVLALLSFMTPEIREGVIQVANKLL